MQRVSDTTMAHKVACVLVVRNKYPVVLPYVIGISGAVEQGVQIL